VPIDIRGNSSLPLFYQLHHYLISIHLVSQIMIASTRHKSKDSQVVKSTSQNSSSVISDSNTIQNITKRSHGKARLSSKKLHKYPILLPTEIARRRSKKRKVYEKYARKFPSSKHLKGVHRELYLEIKVRAAEKKVIRREIAGEDKLPKASVGENRIVSNLNRDEEKFDDDADGESNIDASNEENEVEQFKATLSEIEGENQDIDGKNSNESL
jgi:hypothetical protein